MSKQIVKWIFVLACVGSCLSGGVYFMARSAIDNLMKQDSRAKSSKWTEQIVGNVPDIDRIAEGATPSAEALQYLTFVAKSVDVDHFDIYSKSGQLKLESEKLGAFKTDGTALQDHNSEALQVAESGKPLVIIEDEVEDGERKVLAETYLPILRNGKFLGVASVYIDQTDLAADLKKKFTVTAAAISALTAIGFALPALGALMQMRRRQRSDEKAAHLATHDVLTDLPNRAQMEASLQGLIDAAAARRELAALHFIDIDYFKDLNVRHGHSFGDELLRSVANRLKGLVRATDMVARYGGDEFLLFQAGYKSPDEIGARAHDLKVALSQSYEIQGRPATVTASIGTAMFPANGTTWEDLVASAGIALHSVKALESNGHSFFEPSMKDKKQLRAEIEALIRSHIKAQSFELHYQPLYELDGRKLKSFEALLRMRDESGNFVSPAKFIPVAEDLGLIDRIGHWVLAEACRTASNWPSDIKVAVNLSAVQFRHNSVLAAVQSALALTGLAPNRLVLEVTESVLISDGESVLKQLRDLKGLGVQLAIDDFGTGYSSLSYMVHFPFDRIKIDRSFVKPLAEGGKKARQLVQSIVSLGHNMDMKVTAEGVETEAQAAELISMRCDDVQGFLYSRPVPVHEVAALILRDFRNAQDSGADREHLAAGQAA